MKTNETTFVESNENKINYQFIPVPLKLFYCCDLNCRSLLVSLTQSSTAFATEKGWFFRTVEQLCSDTLLSENVLRAALDSLFKKKIIEIIYNDSEGHFFKINFEEFSKYETIEFENCRNEENSINTQKYKNSHYSPSYCTDADKRKERLKKKMAKSEDVMAKSEDLKSESEYLLLKSEDNIDKLLNKNKKENKDKLLNKENDFSGNYEYSNLLDLAKDILSKKQPCDYLGNHESVVSKSLSEDNFNNTSASQNKVSTNSFLIEEENKDLNKEDIKQIEANAIDLKDNSTKENKGVGNDKKEAVTGSFESKTELNDNSNEDILNNNESASQNEETSTINNINKEELEQSNTLMEINDNFNEEGLNNNMNEAALQRNELTNSNEDNLNEGVSAVLSNNSNEDYKVLGNLLKEGLNGCNKDNIKNNGNSNEVNNEMKSNNKEETKELPCNSSKSATPEVGSNFDSAAARPAAPAVSEELINTINRLIRSWIREDDNEMFEKKRLFLINYIHKNISNEDIINQYENTIDIENNYRKEQQKKFNVYFGSPSKCLVY